MDICPGQTVVLRDQSDIICTVVQIDQKGKKKGGPEVLVRTQSGANGSTPARLLESWVPMERLQPYRASSAPDNGELGGRRPSLVTQMGATPQRKPAGAYQVSQSPSLVPKNKGHRSAMSPEAAGREGSAGGRRNAATPKGAKKFQKSVNLAQSPQRGAGRPYDPMAMESIGPPSLMEPLQIEAPYSMTSEGAPPDPPPRRGKSRGRVGALRDEVHDTKQGAQGPSAVAMHRPAVFTGFQTLGNFDTNEEPGSSGTTPTQLSPVWGGEVSPRGNDGSDIAGEQWDELMNAHKASDEVIDEDIPDQLGDQSGESVTHQSMLGDSSQSRVQYKWRRGHMLGAGSYGRVYLGMNLNTGELIAVKQLEYMDSVEADREKVESLESEIAIMRTLRHPNICGYLGTERSEGEDTKILNILLEYVPGGSISQLLVSFGAFGENVIRLYTRQILLGLQYLHGNKLAHRDIKGANILVTSDGCVKLTDFGHSKRLEGTAATLNFNSLKGTPFWMAPEVIKQEGHGRRADIWSVGCTVVEMGSGKPPWSELSNPMTAMFAIASSEEPPAIPEGLTEEAHQFIALCFRRNPSERPTAADLMSNPFVVDAKMPVKLPNNSAFFSRVL